MNHKIKRLIKQNFSHKSNKLILAFIYTFTGLITITILTSLWSSLQPNNSSKQSEETDQLSNLNEVDRQKTNYQINPEKILSSLPKNNKYQRLAAVQDKIMELEKMYKSSDQELSQALSSSFILKPLQLYGEREQIRKSIVILQEEKDRISLDIVSESSF